MALTPQQQLLYCVAQFDTETQRTIYASMGQTRKTATRRYPFEKLVRGYRDGLYIKADLALACRADPISAMLYVDHFGAPRLKRFEDVIMTDPIAASEYAIKVIERPWPRAETKILEDFTAWNNYLAAFPQSMSTIIERHRDSELYKEALHAEDSKISNRLLRFYEHNRPTSGDIS